MAFRHECLEWPLGWPMCRIWMDEDRVLHREPLATLELALVEAMELVGRLTLARRPARLRRLVIPHGGSVVSLDKVLGETKAIGVSPYQRPKTEPRARSTKKKFRETFRIIHLYPHMKVCRSFGNFFFRASSARFCFGALMLHLLMLLLINWHNHMQVP